MLPPKEQTPFNKSILGRLGSIEKNVKYLDDMMNRVAKFVLALLEEREDLTDEDKERLAEIRRQIYDR